MTAYPVTAYDVMVLTTDSFPNEEHEAMTSIPWAKEFAAAITVCDAAGVILEMNDRAAEAFAGDGGRGLIGSNLLDCHPEPSRSKLQEMLTAEKVNVYTMEKGGVKKLVYQAPWYEEGKYRGYIELALVLPDVLPHFVRDGD